MPEHIKSKVSTHPERVGSVQEKPKFPDTKEKIDKEFTSVQLASVGYHSGSAKEHLGMRKTGVAAAEQVCTEVEAICSLASRTSVGIYDY